MAKAGRSNSRHGETRRDDSGDRSLRGLFEDSFLRPLAALLLIRSSLVGLGLWIPLLLTPAFAAVGLLALLFMAVLDRFLAQAELPTLSMEFRANGLLSALVSYWVLGPIGLSAATLVVAIGAAVLVSLYLVFLGKSFHGGKGLPVTVWPYCIVAAVMLTLFSGMEAAPGTYFGWPDMSYRGVADLPRAFLSGLGVFVFSPSVLSGAVIAILIAAWSPVMFLTGVIGWVSGALFSIALVSIGASVNWVPASYNSFLAGMALGAVFIVPGLRGLVTASFAGMLAALVAAFLQVQTGNSGISYLPIPFIITLYSGLATITAMGLVGRDRAGLALGERPEIARISADWLESRWGSEKSLLLGVPVRGPVEITQGVNGPLTHRGGWRHALDLQRPKTNPGTEEEARPSIWGVEVFAPVQGQVVAVQNAIPDNPLGSLNYGENWGNHVILRSDRGTYVALCHLEAGSVMVQPGQRVSFDTFLGRVGNSGRSAMPHLHMQRQSGPAAGSPTKPFRLANYFEADISDGRYLRWRASGLPLEQQVIAAASPNPAVHDLLTGMLPGRGLWAQRTGEPGAATDSGSLIVTTSFTESGLFRMESRDGDFFEAELDIDAFRIVSVSAPRNGMIEALAAAMSTVPYAAFEGIAWEDAFYVPDRSRNRSLRALTTSLFGAPLTRVSSRLGRIAEDGGAEIAATYRFRNPGPENTVHLHLARKRGPTFLSWGGSQDRTEMELVSFEVHPA